MTYSKFLNTILPCTEETTADASSKTAGGDETAPVTETVGAIEETTTVQPTDWYTIKKLKDFAFIKLSVIFSIKY